MTNKEREGMVENENTPQETVGQSRYKAEAYSYPTTTGENRLSLHTSLLHCYCTSHLACRTSSSFLSI